MTEEKIVVVRPEIHMPEEFRKALELDNSKTHAPPNPVIIESRVNVPSLGPVDVAHEPHIDVQTKSKKQSKRKEFLNRIADRPLQSEFTGKNRAARRAEAKAKKRAK